MRYKASESNANFGNKVGLICHIANHGRRIVRSQCKLGLLDVTNISQVNVNNRLACAGGLTVFGGTRDDLPRFVRQHPGLLTIFSSYPLLIRAEETLL